MDDDSLSVLLLIIFAIATSFIGFLGGLSMGQKTATANIREQAIEAGAAEWVINSKTGERAFVWKNE